MIYGCQSLVTTTYKGWILRKCMEEIPENGTLCALFGRVFTAGVNKYQQSYISIVQFQLVLGSITVFLPREEAAGNNDTCLDSFALAHSHTMTQVYK